MAAAAVGGKSVLKDCSQVTVYCLTPWYKGQCINIPNSSRGKRKLDFTSKPLYGKVFFLDLPHGQKSPGSIEHEITQRGGIVEAFFYKKVRYMVTNRHKVKNKGAACSPLTLSPDTPEGGVGGRGGVTFNSPAYGTRAAKMLEASVSL